MSINITVDDRRETDRIRNEERLKKKEERDKKKKERDSIGNEFSKLYKFEDTIRLHAKKVTLKEIKDQAKKMFGEKYKTGGTYGEGEEKATNHSAGELRAALITIINTKHNLGVQIEIKQVDGETKPIPKTVLTREEVIKVD
jgi:hypothetical protein